MSWSRKAKRAERSIGKGVGGTLRGLGMLARWGDRQKRRAGPSAPPPTIAESLAPYRQVKVGRLAIVAGAIIALGLLYAAYILFFV